MLIALIPARGGSDRIPNKNIRYLHGLPLIYYTLDAAISSGLFDSQIYVSTDSDKIKDEVSGFGRANVNIIHRPGEYATGDSPDIEWIQHAMGVINLPEAAHFIILRPTNPFRTANTIKRAWDQMNKDNLDLSMRSISPVKAHPEKMWRKLGNYIVPISLTFGLGMGGLPCDQPSQNLSPIWQQNGCIQISNASQVRRYGNYTGAMVQAFVTQGYEGFDLNTEEDWILAEELIHRKVVLV